MLDSKSNSAKALISILMSKGLTVTDVEEVLSVFSYELCLGTDPLYRAKSMIEGYNVVNECHWNNQK